MGLIAREIESEGIPTLCLTSALSITRAVNPSRAVYLDYPLGHTAGKPHEPELQDAIIEAALSAFESMEVPGSVEELPFHWAKNNDWKDSVMRRRSGSGSSDKSGHADDRSERSAEPQYQRESDRVAAEAIEGSAQGSA
ncbi:MAG: hypothetical protein ABGX04_15350 [Myxococcales bacterium]|nr:hypothetical protein [Myxococcales bacterium]HIK84175.1 hypothetical protein [Myxococcales bacterium]